MHDTELKHEGHVGDTLEQRSIHCHDRVLIEGRAREDKACEKSDNLKYARRPLPSFFSPRSRR